MSITYMTDLAKAKVFFDDLDIEFNTFPGDEEGTETLKIYGDWGREAVHFFFRSDGSFDEFRISRG